MRPRPLSPRARSVPGPGGTRAPWGSAPGRQRGAWRTPRTPRQPHLRRRGSCRCRAHTRHTAALSRGAGSCTAHCEGRRLRAASRPQSSGRLGGQEAGGCAAGRAARPASREDTYGHRRGSRGGRGCTPGRRRPCSRGGSDTARLPRRPRPGRPGGRSCRLQAAESGRGTRGCPLPRPGPSPSAHRGSRGSRGSRGGSGHSEGHQTQAGTGSGQPRRSPRAGSLRGCSHTLWSRGVRGLSRAGQPRPHARPRARGGLTHAGRGGSGSSQGHSGRTRSPRSLPGTCTGPSLGHSHRPPLRG